MTPLVLGSHEVTSEGDTEVEGILEFAGLLGQAIARKFP